MWFLIVGKIHIQRTSYTVENDKKNQCLIRYVVFFNDFSIKY